ncbi:MAG: restriction endonuclease [Sandaracinaceae bacterium]|nr:restriction endonuclease [Sandaracinaceae bacterium]
MTTVPTFDQFIEPLLAFLATHQDPVPTRDAYEAVADRVGLTDAQRAELVPSGRQPTYKNRIGWAHDRLKRAGYSASPKRGYWQLTADGRLFASRHAHGIPVDLLREIAFPRSLERLRDGTDGDAPTVGADDASPLEETRTPEERLKAAYDEIRARVRGELLEMVRHSSPAFFEKLVLDVLLAIGYGASRDDLKQTGGSGDGGIDGVISLDRLGLEKVYVQAKRYAEDNVVGRPAVQSFAGALTGRGKGVFLTTSRFSKEARDFATARLDSVVLVDGEQLGELMMDSGVGVSRQETYTLVAIDSDYFEQD